MPYKYNAAVVLWARSTLGSCSEMFCTAAAASTFPTVPANDVEFPVMLIVNDILDVRDLS